MKRLLAAFALAALLASPAHAQVASVTLDFTAPGDDGNVGTATLYSGRFATTRPDTTNATALGTWWSSASVIAMPTPQVAGTQQSVSITPTTGFISGRTYFFAMYAEDEVGNRSPISNIAWLQVTDTIGPSCPCNLKLRVP